MWAEQWAGGGRKEVGGGTQTHLGLQGSSDAVESKAYSDMEAQAYIVSTLMRQRQEI